MKQFISLDIKFWNLVMISKKTFYIFIISFGVSGYSYVLAEREPEPSALFEPSIHDALDDDLDSFLDELIRGEVEVDETEIQPVSRLELLLRRLGGPVALAYVWVVNHWYALKFKLTRPCNR